MQLDLLDLLKPPPVAYVPPAQREVITRAYGADTTIKLDEEDPDPFYIEVRGIPCMIEPTFGFKTYTIQGAGTLFWSETGFRSFTVGEWQPRLGLVFDGGPEDIARAIEAYIDAKASSGGCGGKLVKWWPFYVLQWRQDVSSFHKVNRSKIWAQWGEERHAECWRRYDQRQAEALRRMVAEGIDPNDVEPPHYHKGEWPRVDVKALSSEAA